MSTATQPVFTPEFAAAFRDLMAQSIRQELETTKRVLAAVPDNCGDYRPADKCRSGREIAWHIAKEDVLFLEQTYEGKFDFADDRYNQEPKTIAEMVEWYDTNMRRVLASVLSLTPEQLLQPLDFMGIVTLPRLQYLLLMNNHSVHHRGQLSVYLRPMGAKVPSIYGPSADTELEESNASAAD